MEYYDMIKTTYTFLVILSLISNSYAGKEDEREGPTHVPINFNSPSTDIREQTDQQINLTPPGEIIHLDENVLDGSNEEFVSVKKVSCSKKILGYSARCGTLFGCTLIGAGIGAAIVSGEFSPEILDGLIRIGMPIIAGGGVGYGLGWGLGNYAKARITGRI
jgi:hypothetical protein